MTHLLPLLEFFESQKDAARDLTFCPEASVNKPNQVQRKMAPTTPRIINPLLRILWMDSGDGGAAGAVAVAMSARKNQGKKAPGRLKTLKVLNHFGPAGRQNPPRSAKFDGGVREP